ncbi:MAG TPA: flagellar biosynthesis protein FlhB [Spirochaetota bacterium]|nr:flagellar biosynthesis protein FlhB [Spirochaetota bacterium]HPH02666.1 flagellar biosynthesis protein FlhB [Spirochaetota bacterium]HPN82055.1 flagellar biosynthesis protein FlhB [Spirochaetota bacterium]
MMEERLFLVNTLLPPEGRFLLDLQFFAAEDEGRTEDPTESRKRKAREEGKVPKSQDMSAALVLLVVFWTLAFFGSHMVTGFREAFTYCIDNMYTLEISTNSLRTLFLHFVLLFFEILAPILIMAIIIGVAANVMQVGFLFTWKPVKPELSRISFTPQKIFQRVLFSKQAMVNLVKSVLKIVVIGIVAWLIIEGELPKMINLMDVGVAGAMDSITNVVFVMVNATCLALLALSVPDYIFQRRQHLESLKMSIPEIKEEHKMEEGDPLIKSRIMQKSRELAQRNLPAMVKKADVVITNPTHLSVALQFDMNIHDQPVVVAKGADHLAFVIRQIATEAGVPIMENKPLARALYHDVNLGDPIPESLFSAVVTVYQRLEKFRNRDYSGVRA